MVAAFVAVLAALVAGCGSDSSDPGAEATAGASAPRPAVGQAAELARIGAMSRAPIAAIGNPDAGPRTLERIAEKLDLLVRRSARVRKEVERTGAPLPAAVLAAAKLQRRALERGSALARKLAAYEKDANRERTPSTESHDELVVLAANVDDLRPLARNAGETQNEHLAALRELMRSATEVAETAQVATPAPLDEELQGDPQLRGQLVLAVKRTSRMVNALVPSVTPAVPATTTTASTVVDCGDDPGIYALAARDLSCADAHRLATAAVGALAPSFAVYGFNCVIAGDYSGPEPGVFYQAGNVQCARGTQAIRFDFAD